MDMSEKANVTFGGPVTVKMPKYIHTRVHSTLTFLVDAMNTLGDFKFDVSGKLPLTDNVFLH